MSGTRGLALTLAVAAWCFLALASLIIVIGPLAVPVLGISVSHPFRLLAAGGVAVVGACLVSRQPGLLLNDLAVSAAPYRATVMLASVLLSALLLARGSASVGGADSAGYLAQAHRWQTGTVRVPLPLDVPGLRETAWLQSGLGFRPDPTGTATVPSYPPGLPWLQVAALHLGEDVAAVRGVPFLAMLLAVWAITLLVVPRSDPASAALGVIAFVSLPTLLFQALQPMSDVPALAGWILALALAGRPSAVPLAGAAVATTIAILVRPNLAPLAFAVAWQAVLAAQHRAERLRNGLLILGGAGVAALIIAAVQASLYGSALQSGYGRASELFSLTHVRDNLSLYPAWLLASTSWPGLVALVAGAVGLVVRSARDAGWRPAVLMGTVTMGLYLVYAPFDSWTYLRFVLIPLSIAGAGIAVIGAHGWPVSPGRWRFPLFAVLVLLVALPNLQRAQALGVFDVRAREFRYEAAGTFVRDHLPSSVVIVAGQHSTSAPLYSGRPVLRADLLDPAAFAAVAEWARTSGRPLAFVLDAAEADAFRQRSGGRDLATLDWPPRAEIGRPVTTRVWLSDDRAVYRAGGHVPTRRVASMPRE